MGAITGAMAAVTLVFWGTPIVRACCDEGDAFFSDDYSFNPDGTVTVTITQASSVSAKWGAHLIGKKFTVDPAKIRNVANPLGRGVIFINPVKIDEQTHTVFCFIPGPLV